MALNIDTEVDRNFAAFQHMLPDLLQKAPGKFVLLHKQRVIELFDNSVSAVVAGIQRFGEDEYSVQEVSDQPDNLGFYSYAGGAGQA
ncbi:MAG: hypothetical protein WC804_07530 [Sphingomonas sp.]|uniref:hypothetical protein n=1 Tax=Sphingomonas sp. TaxID=28214 RepID=UPI00356ACD3A